MAAAKNFRGVATASRDAQQRLVLNTFTVSADGKTVTKKAERTGTSIGDALSVTATPGALVTAFKQVSGKMRIESYPLSSTGSIGRLKGSPP